MGCFFEAAMMFSSCDMMDRGGEDEFRVGIEGDGRY